MKYVLLFILSMFAAASPAQELIERYQPQSGTMQVGPAKDQVFPRNEKGYSIYLPSSNTVNAVVVSLEDARLRPTVADSSFNAAVNARGMAAVYLSTGIPIDLYFGKSSLQYTDSLLQSVLSENGWKEKPIFFIGVNLGAHRAMRLIEYSSQQKSDYYRRIKAVVLCEGVLDWVRQWNEGEKAIRNNFAESSVSEAKTIDYLLTRNLGGTPKTGLQSYLNFSSYSYSDPTNRHLRHYQHVAFRAYSEPATHYWMEVKRKTAFDTNFPDQVGIINELKLAGNKNAELILFHQDRSIMDRRNPDYTWGLVDKTELAAWLGRLIN